MDKTPLEKKIAKDQKIMKILKVSELRYHIGQTNLGPIDLMIRYGEEKYNFLLDSGPLDDNTEEGKEKNDKMLEMFNLK